MYDISAHIKLYIDHCRYQKKLNEKSLKAYAIDLNQFSGFESGEAHSYSKVSILSYITYIHKTYKPRTAKRKIASLKAFLNYLQNEEILETNPLHRIQTRFQEPQILPRTIPLDIVEKLLYVAYGELKCAATKYAQQAALRNAAILELLFATGMRVSELCSLDSADIDLNSGSILIMGKGSKERILQIGNRQVLAILEQYGKAFAGQIADKGCFFINRLGIRISEQ
jgi:integrase/recombinase XerD